MKKIIVKGKKYEQRNAICGCVGCDFWIRATDKVPAECEIAEEKYDHIKCNAVIYIVCEKN